KPLDERRRSAWTPSRGTPHLLLRPENPELAPVGRAATRGPVAVGSSGRVPRPLWMRPGRLVDTRKPRAVQRARGTLNRSGAPVKWTRARGVRATMPRPHRVRGVPVGSSKGAAMTPSNPILLLSFLSIAAGASASESAPPPGEIRLSIARDPYVSSDQVTLCRVRAVNDGSRTWPGKSLRFEARAPAATPVVRQRGRFGLELPPHGTLETVVALPGRHDRLEVELLAAGSADGGAKTPRLRGAKRKKARGASKSSR